jgi:hypothetical protein
MKLIRTDTSDEGTFGILLFDDTFIHTIELPDRGNQPNLSCIPRGKYTLRLRHSPRYGNVYHVENVPGRTHILLHHGNYAGDKTLGFHTHSAGCILVGSKRGRLSGQNAVLASRSARRKLETRMKFLTTELEII